MGLAPISRPTGLSQKPDGKAFTFKPIQLSTKPLLNGTGGGEAGGKTDGIVFTGTDVTDALDEVFSCCGRYSLRNTNHVGIAGLTEDGRMIFGVNTRVNGRYTTAFGAFDKAGRPVAPTRAQQDLLSRYLPNVENPIVLDAKASGALGIKTGGSNPRAGVYVGNNQIIYDFAAGMTFGSGPDATAIDVNANVTTDWRSTVTNRSIGMAARRGTASIGGSLAQNGTETVQSVEAAYDKWSASGRLATNQGSRNRQLDIAYRPNERVTITASWKPDNKPVAPSRPATYSIDSQPQMQDFSNYGIKIEIKLP